MSLKDETLLKAYARSRGRCECSVHHDEAGVPHPAGRCTKTFVGREYWRALYSDDAAGPDRIAIYCVTCYRIATGAAHTVGYAAYAPV